MKKIITIIFLVLTFSTSLHAEEHTKYGMPSTDSILLYKLGYTVSYDIEYKSPKWVAYHLTSDRISGPFKRRNNFRIDPDIQVNQQASLKDYRKSGYDRGHMAPAAVMKWSKRTMSESFLLSNMSPQVGVGFNRGIWKTLESKIRKWVAEREELYIVTGPIYAGNTFKTIGRNKVVVPTHFYKVIFDPIRVEVIAFILPNKKFKKVKLSKFIVSVDKVEKLTNLDFLSEIQDSIEQQIEAVVLKTIW